MAETVAGGEARVSQRLKRLHRIAEKLVRADFRGRLSQMEDIGGCRAVVQSLDHLLRLRDRVTARWAATMRAESARDYVASPKADGYRAVHLVVERDGLLVEVQLRTHRQHLWATNVERLEARVGRPLRGGHASERMGEALRGLSEALAMLDRGLPVPATYREHMAQWLAVLDPKA
jgi:ppGpp synthetase/RelA/SpoT-type nucleotidyltranferase